MYGSNVLVLTMYPTSRLELHRPPWLELSRTGPVFGTSQCRKRRFFSAFQRLERSSSDTSTMVLNRGWVSHTVPLFRAGHRHPFLGERQRSPGRGACGRALSCQPVPDRYDSIPTGLHQNHQCIVKYRCLNPHCPVQVLGFTSHT